MSDIEKVDLKSMDITEEKRQKLREIFPEVFTEKKVDFDKLKSVLGDIVETGRERYGMNWAGKADCLRIIQQPSVGTLKPCRKESVDFDKTENLFIEGDNLEVLKLLQKSYYGKVKMIYIDPPYNTGKDFIYPDNFSESLDTYLKYTGQVDSEGRKYSTNAETDGRFHTRWMNMIYPRLYLARNLLREDGVILINIGETELKNLLALAEEIFGEENKNGVLVWEKKKKGAFLALTLTNIKDYIVVVSKSKDAFAGLIGQIVTETETYPCINASNARELRRIPPGIISKYREANYVLKKGSTITSGTMNMVLHSDLIIEDGRLKEELVIEGNWRYNDDLMKEYANNGSLYLTQDLYLRRIVDEPRYKKLKDILPRVGDSGEAGAELNNIENLFADGWGTNEDANEELRVLLGVQNVFDYPKPFKLLAKLCASLRDKNAIILDFFAGSCPLAHAVLELNNKDNGNRKFLCVQLPEPCEEDSEGFRAGYKTIADIGKERIRRVIKKIQEKAQPELGTDPEKQDLGFKVFKLDKSNFRLWDGEKPEGEEAIKEQLKLHIDHIDPKSKTEDILYELLLKSGFELTTRIEKLDLAGKEVFSIEDGALLICLDEALTKETIKAMAEKAPAMVICLDRGFKDNDQLKTNAVQIMKSKEVEFRTV